MALLDFLKRKSIKEDIDIKAFIKDQSYNMWQIIYGEGSVKEYTPKQLLAYNTGWTYVCNNKNSQTLASIPYKLYYKNTTGKELAYYKTNKVNKKQLNFINNTCNTCKKAYDTEDLVEIEDHPVLTLLQHPNDRMNYIDFAALIQSYLGLIGNAYVYKETDSQGNIIALYPLLSENVSAVVAENNFGYGDIRYYKYCTSTDRINSNKDFIIPKDKIIHFINYQPGNAVYGKGELEAAISCAEREFYYNQVENYLNHNNARPDFLVSYKNGMTENQQKEIQKLWYKKYGSVVNSGKPLITNGDVEVKQLGFSPRDMQYLQGRISLREEICAIYGVPEALILINQSNFASAKSATEHYLTFTIKPKLDKYLEKLNEQLIQLYDNNLFIWYDGEFNTSQNPLDTANIDKIYIDSKVYSPEYVRERLGIPEDEAIDETEVEDTEEETVNPK